MTLDLILRNARLAGRNSTFDVRIRDGHIADIAPQILADAPQEDLGGRLVTPGFVETHIHLDKSCILDRCRIQSQARLEEAIGTSRRRQHARLPKTMSTGAGQPNAGKSLSCWHDADANPCGGRSADRFEKLFRDPAPQARLTPGRLTLRFACFRRKGFNDPGTEDLLIAACEQWRGPHRRLSLHR